MHNLSSFHFSGLVKTVQTRHNNELQKWAIYGPNELDLKKKKKLKE